MGDAETWRWIWLILAILLAVGEMSTAGFFLLPFALGALTASVLAFVGLGLEWELLGFAVVSAISFAGMRPLARRLDAQGITHGIGSRRLIGQEATVLAAITPDEGGMIKVLREEWRADSEDGTPIPAGTNVTVVEVIGTRCVVRSAPLGIGPIG